MAARIRYGLRRYPLIVVIFLAAAIGFSVWASQIDKPTFVFPLGRLAPEDARVAVFGGATLAAVYVVAMTYVRFVRRPAVVLEKGRATIPLGEFGLRTVTLQKGDVIEIIDETRRGGWRGARVRHAGGDFVIWSSQLGSDEDYDRVRKKLETLRSKER